MKSCNARTIIALIATVSILTLFCGSIFACILPDAEEAGTMARCPSNPGQRGDGNKNVCSPTEFAKGQNNIKLPQDIKEIRIPTFLGQDQILHSNQTGLIQAYINFRERVYILYIPDKVEIFIKDLSLRL